MKKRYAVRYFQLMVAVAASTVSVVGGRLHDAAEAGNTEAIRSLLSQGFDIEAFHSGLTPLHLAAREGHVEAIRLLLQKGADIEGKGHDELTPLHWAAREGHVEAVRLLLDQGADSNAKGDLRSGGGSAIF